MRVHIPLVVATSKENIERGNEDQCILKRMF